MAEERSLAAGEARIKFTCNRVGSYWELVEGNPKEKKLLENTTKKLAGKKQVSITEKMSRFALGIGCYNSLET